MPRANRLFFRLPMHSAGVVAALFSVVAQDLVPPRADVRADKASTKTIRPTDPVLQYVGRTAIVPIEPNGDDDGYDAVMYDMPGVEVRFQVTGTRSISVLMQQHWADGPAGDSSDCDRLPGDRPNSFLAFKDGVRHNVAPLPGGKPSDFNAGSTCHYCTFDTLAHGRSEDIERYDLFTDLDPSQWFEIRLSKDSEADFQACEPWPNWVKLHGIIVESGGHLTRPKQPHSPPAKIEIIGGSITSGLCNLCGVPWHADVSDLQQQIRGTSLHKSWVGQMCGPHLMDAHCHITAWSGMGIATSNLDPLAKVLLPTVFNRTVQSLPDQGNQWNFSIWRPDVVILDIGHEDLLVYDRPEFEFDERFKQLVYSLVDVYGKDIKILAGCGMTVLTYCRKIQALTNFFINHHIYVHYLDLARPGENTCCKLPDSVKHERTAALVMRHVMATMADDNGPGRTGRGSTAAIFMLVCFLVTGAFFLIWKLLRRCTGMSRDRGQSYDADAGDETLRARDYQLGSMG